MAPSAAATPATTARDALAKELLEQQHALKGQNRLLLSRVIGMIGHTDDALMLAEIAGLLARYPYLGALSRITGPLATLLFPVGAFVSVLDAKETGLRLYGTRAIAYAATAWAFDKPLPDQSRRIMGNLRSTFPVVAPEDVTRYHKVWRQASSLTRSQLTLAALQNEIGADSMKLILRAIGDNKPRRLCLHVLQRFEDRMSYIEKMAWTSNYTVLYPD